jgi:hypothetical protein
MKSSKGKLSDPKHRVDEVKARMQRGQPRPEPKAPPASSAPPVAPATSAPAVSAVAANDDVDFDGITAIANSNIAMTKNGLLGSAFTWRKTQFVTLDGASFTEIDFTVENMRQGYTEFGEEGARLLAMEGPGQPLPPRAAFGNMDPAKWPLGLDGRPRDPIALTFFVYMRSRRTSLPFTFTTTSDGGRRSVTMLAQEIAAIHLTHPDVRAIIKLGARHWNHKEFGPMQSPGFEVKSLLKPDGTSLPLASSLDDDDIKY